MTKLTDVANRISKGEMVTDLPVIKSRNDIYELNEGLKSVVTAVQILTEVANIQEAEKTKTDKK